MERSFTALSTRGLFAPPPLARLVRHSLHMHTTTNTRALVEMHQNPYQRNLQDGTRLATGGQEKLLRIFDLAQLKEEHALAGHTDIIREVVWTSESTLIR